MGAGMRDLKINRFFAVDAMTNKTASNRRAGGSTNRHRFSRRLLATVFAGAFFVAYPMGAALADVQTTSNNGDAGGLVVAPNAPSTGYGLNVHDGANQGGCGDEYTDKLNSLADSANSFADDGLATTLAGVIAEGVGVAAEAIALGTEDVVANPLPAIGAAADAAGLVTDAVGLGLSISGQNDVDSAQTITDYITEGAGQQNTGGVITGGLPNCDG